ncbi:hypothetical protein LCGC14_0225470 [marine sediment metagenome]|uniref:Uncharacterized protein n=1 Tax=marine sediment metagenome TaxID=412755 RepID=A0A0F9XGA6_9ZZZZ
MSNKQLDQEKDINLCSCLYDVIINLDNTCVRKTDSDISNKIDYVESLRHYAESTIGYSPDEECDREDFIEDYKDIFVRLALITNEQLNSEGIIYYRVHRIVFDRYIINANILRDKYNVSIWSDCHSLSSQASFLIYWKGHLLLRMDCPPDIGDILHSMKYFDRPHKPIMSIIDLTDDIKTQR